MKYRRTLLAAALALPLSPLWAQTSRRSPALNREALGPAIDQAGAQRMLSQRMAKAWLSLALDVPAYDAKRVLEQSMQRFERQLEALLGLRAETRPHFTELGQRYQVYKSLLAQAPQAQRAPELLSQAAHVLAQAHQATGSLQQLAGKPAAALVNTSGRQRMLSQRLSLLYIASQAPGVDAAKLKTEMQGLRGEFLKAHALLREAPEATPRIRDELALADTQWLFFDRALSGQTQGSRAAAEVFTTSENLLDVMERVTGLYARVLSG